MLNDPEELILPFEAWAVSCPKFESALIVNATGSNNF
jgi:hypothetical protein